MFNTPPSQAVASSPPPSLSMAPPRSSVDAHALGSDSAGSLEGSPGASDVVVADPLLPPPLVIVPRLTPGRRADPVWNQVDVDPEGGVWCKKCHLLIHATGRTHVERVKHHFNNRCVYRAVIGRITDTYRPRMKPEISRKFQELFAAWVFSTGMAFYKVNHASLRDALRLLCPEVEVPSAKQLANTLLDQAYASSIKRVKVALTGKAATLVTDAWTDILGFSVIKYVAICGAETFFLESVYTGSTSHDAQFLAGDIRRVVGVYNFMTLGAVVTDNTAANKAAWTLLQDQLPRTFFHGCACHALHLLVKDLIFGFNWLDGLSDGCKVIFAFFKKIQKLWHTLTTRLKADGLCQISRPADTRWGSLLASMKNIRAAEQILFSLVSARDFLVAKTKKQKRKRRTVHDLARAPDFVTSLDKGIRLLESISKYIEIFESNTTPLSDVYKAFLDLPAKMSTVGLSASELKTSKRLISERFDFVYGDAHGLAYALDPCFLGNGMDGETRASVETFIVEWYGEEKADEVLVELAGFPRFVRDYSDRSPRQWELLNKRKISVYDFWCGMPQFPLLQEIALQLFRCATSSAASERNFSTHAYIHSKLRNCLAASRVEKLVHIFFNAKNVEDADLARYTELEDTMRAADEDSEDEQENFMDPNNEFVFQ